MIVQSLVTLFHGCSYAAAMTYAVLVQNIAMCVPFSDLYRKAYWTSKTA
jgi:hypothetical protein